MTDLAIITPTRGRPERFAELVDAVNRTATGHVQIWAGLDDDDETEYPSAVRDVAAGGNVVAYRRPRRSLSAWTNFLADRALLSADPPRYLASLGDDHLPRQPKGWDRKMIDAIEALPGPGFAYGNDLFQGQNLPTAWVVSAEVVKALGWMMLPTCAHMYVDNAILALGRAAGRITYCPDVVIEHLHPNAEKGAWDASYRESNTEKRFAEDKNAFESWVENGLNADADKVRRLAAHVARGGR